MPKNNAQPTIWVTAKNIATIKRILVLVIRLVGAFQYQMLINSAAGAVNSVGQINNIGIIAKYIAMVS